MSLTAASLDSNSLSTLFSGMNTSSSNGGTASSTILSDYYSIRNGSYYKMMKSYYSKTDASSDTTSTQKEDSVTTLNKVQTDAGSLKKSTDALLAKGSSSVFSKVSKTDADGKTSTEYDTDAIYKAVNSYINDYNAMLTTGGKSGTTGVLTSVSGMTGSTAANEKALSKLGITVGSDNKLSIDETIFKKADMSVAKSLFNTTGGYGYQIGAKASMASYYAKNEATYANSYTSGGKYQLTNAASSYNNYI